MLCAFLEIHGNCELIKDSETSYVKKSCLGNSLVVQGVGLRAFTADGLSLIPGRRTSIPQAMQHKKIEKLFNIVYIRGFHYCFSFMLT